MNKQPMSKEEVRRQRKRQEVFKSRIAAGLIIVLSIAAMLAWANELTTR